MALNQDFRDLFAALNDARAKYLLVGGYAVAYHGCPRFTKDLDIWVESNPENALLVLTALRNFGAPVFDLTLEDLSSPGLIFQMGLPPNRIDILTSIDGVAFAEAWSAHEQMLYGEQIVSVIGKAHLLQNKKASGRARNLLDVEWLTSSKG